MGRPVIRVVTPGPAPPDTTGGGKKDKAPKKQKKDKKEKAGKDALAKGTPVK